MSVWPLNRMISVPVAASQMRAVLSSDAVTTRRPSGENAALTTAVGVSVQPHELPARRNIPDARGLIGRRRDDAPPIG